MTRSRERARPVRARGSSVLVAGLLVHVVWACGRLEIGSYADAAEGGGPPSLGSGGVPLDTGPERGGIDSRGGGNGRPSTGGSASGNVAATGGEKSAGGAVSTSGSGATAVTAGEPAVGGATNTTGGAAGNGGDAAAGGVGHAGESSGGTTGNGGALEVGGAAGSGGNGAAENGGADDGGPPSCRRSSSLCGRDLDSCCATNYVPGGTFSNSPESGGLPSASISSFYLDKYEVTVARFRHFLASYDAWKSTGLHEGAGEHPLIPGSGWQAAWSKIIPAAAAEISAEVDNCHSIPASTMPELDGEPVNCVSWYEAFAFCLWDEARLPTEAEWQYAAGGGGVSKLYPWGNTPEPNAELAVFDCNGDPLKCTTCAGCTEVAGILPPVGSRPLGAAHWGQLDMAGSLEEWVFDGAAVAPAMCQDCAWLDDREGRVFRGGAFASPASNLSVLVRNGWDGRNRMHLIGLRCARDRR